MAALVLLTVCSAVLLCVCFALLKWNDVKYSNSAKGLLPPGTMGLPFFGQTADFFKHGPNFMKRQRARYGSVFKSHLLGCPTVVSMDAEVNRYILLNEAKGLVPGYPKSMVEIVGKHNLAAVCNADHKLMRGSMLSLIGPASIRLRLVPQMDMIMRSFIDNWDGKTIDIQQETSEMALLVSFKQVIGDESRDVYENFKREFDKLILGTLSLPINFPGSGYYSGLQGRKQIAEQLCQMMEERRGCGVKYNDFLDDLLGCEDYKLSDEEIIDQIVTLLYSGYETVSTISMMAVKYLHDNPRALQQLREEHFRIQEKKKAEESVSWDDYNNSMSFTRAVIYETARLATVVNGVLRKTTKDVQLNGYNIPEGWKIYVYIREINYDPFLYPEPLDFNPWRWIENKDLKSNKYCFIFGGGTRLCPGKELGIVKTAIFLHHFVTKYRWEEVGGEKLVEFPRVRAPNGLHIRVSEY